MEEGRWDSRSQSEMKTNHGLFGAKMRHRRARTVSRELSEQHEMIGG